MHWYNGGIADAITVTKQKGAIFVVYIEGSDDKSVQITNIINNEAITNKLESENFVAIKIEANSVPHQQFSEIYKQAPSPSIFFIGKSGVPLEIITEVKDLESLSLQIDNILQRAELSPITNTIPSESLIKAEQQSNNVVCENGVCSIRPSTQTMENSTASSSLSAEEKLNRAKELVEKQRIQKQKEEEEKERQKEIERRKMGQNVQQMKRWQEDQELKQLKEEREREKRENQAARDRVLAQIAQDKAERAAKFSTSPPTQPKVATPQAGTSRQQSNVARLQFKLPDGGSNTQEFPSSDSLDQVVTYIKTKLNITKFKLATTFPRREFTTNDYSQSLLDLQLVPNAVILVLPVNSGAVVASSAATSGLYAFFWSLIGPILSIFQYLKGYLTGAGGENDSTSGRSSGGTSSSRGGSVLHVRSKYDLENKLKMAGSTKLVVIDFFATWCGPCRMIAPKLEELAREFPNVMFLKVDVDENRDIASDYRVSSMPTFAFVKNRRTLTNFSGADYYRLRDTVVRYK